MSLFDHETCLTLGNRCFEILTDVPNELIPPLPDYKNNQVVSQGL